MCLSTAAGIATVWYALFALHEPQDERCLPRLLWDWEDENKAEVMFMVPSRYQSMLSLIWLDRHGMQIIFIILFLFRIRIDKLLRNATGSFSKVTSNFSHQISGPEWQWTRLIARGAPGINIMRLFVVSWIWMECCEYSSDIILQFSELNRHGIRGWLRLDVTQFARIGIRGYPPGIRPHYIRAVFLD